MKLWRVLPVIILAAACLACGHPGEQKVRSDFHAENPAFQTISATVGEGHSDAAYYHIRYKKPDDDKIYEQVWLYIRQADGNFKLENKEKETLLEVEK